MLAVLFQPQHSLTAAVPFGVAHFPCPPFHDPPLPCQPPTVQAMSDQQKAELKGRLKDVMSRLMQRDQSAAAMQELHVLRK